MRFTISHIALVAGLAAAIAGVLLLVIGPIIGAAVSPDTVLTVEPVSYAGAIALIIGLAATAGWLYRERRNSRGSGPGPASWSRLTQDYFDTFSHDMGRPFRRIIGKERDVRARLEESGEPIPPSVQGLLDEIEQQAPSFRLMLDNVRVLVELEDPDAGVVMEPVDPAAIVRNIVDRYFSLVGERGLDIAWWSEPQEFGLVYGDAAAIDHIVTNLMDNAAKFATGLIEVRLTRNPTHYYLRVWDDGPGIIESHQLHLFDRGWTPEVAARQEKTSSGLGLYIARTLAQRSGGDIAVESSKSKATGGDAGSDHYTSFTLMLPLRERAGRTR